MGSRGSAESHPHRSTRTREFQCSVVAISLYLSKRPHLLPFVSICSTPMRRSLVLVPSLFRPSAVVNWHFSCPNSTSVLSSFYSWYFWIWNCLQLEFSDNDRLQAGVHVKAVLPFCQYFGHVSSNAKSLLISLTTVRRFCVNFTMIFGHFWKKIFFLKG